MQNTRPSSLLNSLVIGTAALATLTLAGCDDTPDPNSPTVNSAVSRSLNSDQSNAAELLKKLQAQDPSIVDVHFKGTPENRTIVIARKTGEGDEITTTEMPYNQVLPKEVQAQQSASGGMSNMLTGAALGMMAGYMMSNMGRQSWSAPQPQASYNQARERNRSAYVGSAANSYRSSYVSNYRANAAKASSVGRSSGGSFSSSGARAGGYSGGSNGG